MVITMKTKEELNALKAEVEALSGRLGELTDEELEEVMGGAEPDGIEIMGEIVGVLPNAKFVVMLDDGTRIAAYLSGRERTNYINIIVGDRVKVKLSAYDLLCGKIIWCSK